MSEGRSISRYSIYRLRKKRARETAARLQYFKERLLNLQHRRSSYPQIITSAASSQQPPVQTVKDREDQQRKSGAEATSTNESAGLSTPEKKVASQPLLPNDKGYGAIIGAFQSMTEVIRSDIRNVLDRINQLDSRVAVLSEHMEKYHSDVLCNAGNQSPIKPRWRPWFPLQTITDLNTMEQNLENEICRADVVAYVQSTPAGNLHERTRCCLARTISNDLSRHLSWKGTPNRHPFGTTSLWKIILETLAGSCTDRESSVEFIRRTCVAWFQNARDRRGGRSRRRYTYPTMPLLKANKENISLKVEETTQISKNMMIPFLQ
ncbi:unnamed protein product [Calicophoron daubneyi]|uniref:DUF4806 domain-containing protein n=1 Tax=Calicophoron daubneyi TaxID=300641 RepID=A0AAV2SZK1_CALDB